RLKLPSADYESIRTGNAEAAKDADDSYSGGFALSATCLKLRGNALYYVPGGKKWEEATDLLKKAVAEYQYAIQRTSSNSPERIVYLLERSHAYLLLAHSDKAKTA